MTLKWMLRCAFYIWRAFFRNWFDWSNTDICLHVFVCDVEKESGVQRPTGTGVGGVSEEYPEGDSSKALLLGSSAYLKLVATLVGIGSHCGGRGRRNERGQRTGRS